MILSFIVISLIVKLVVKSPITDSVIPGIYYNNLSNNSTDSVIMYTNHRYKHTNRQGTTLNVQEGRWKYNDGKITMYDYMNFNSSYAKRLIWVTDVTNDKGLIKIDINSDIDEFYIKQ